MEIFKLLGTIAIEGITKAQEGLSKVSSSAAAAGEKLKNIGQGMENMGKALAPVTAALGAIGVASVKSASAFEDAIAKVSTIADTTEVPMDSLESAIVELSNSSGIAASEIANNVYDAISAGQKTGDAVNFVSNATKLARAGFAESSDALDILTTIMNAYGLAADEVDAVSNKLIMTQNLGKTTVAQLSAAMGKVIPTAKMTGVNLDELCGSYAVMTANGIATAETTTYLNSMLNELGAQGTTAATAFAKGTEHIKEGGLTMAEAMKQGWSLTDVLSVLDEQAAESGTTINNMFGSAEAGKAAAVLFDNASKLNDAVGQMGESAGATNTAYAKLETTSFSVTKTLNKLKNTGIELGTTILQMLQPGIEKLSEIVSNLSEWFNGLDEGQQRNIATIGGLVAALSPVLLIGGKLISGIGGLVSTIGTISGAIAALNPVTLGIVAAIAAVVAIFVLCRDRVAEVMPQIKEFVGNCFSDIKMFWENHLKPCFEAIGAFIQNVLAPVFKFVFGSIISGSIENAFSFIKDLWEKYLKPVFTGITDFLTGVFTLNFGKAFEGIVNIVKGIFGGIVTIIKQPLNSVISLVNGFIRGLNKIKVPDWVPGLGGKGINISEIPRLESGGVLNKGQVGFLEGNGAEAVVPLDQNSAWISAVAKDMENAGIGGNSQQAQRIIELLETLLDMLPGTMTDAFSAVKFDINNREFARLVKAVN